MCGIFAALSNTSIDISLLLPYIESIRHRGPDHTNVVSYSPNICLGFHRLSINDLSELGNQPLYYRDDNKLAVICNGEIYNHKELESKYNFEMKSKSDCEVILHMYKKFGMQQTCKELDGYFAFVIVDNGKMYAARDSIGVRSLFIAKSNDGFYVSSELKGIPQPSKECMQFPAGHWFDFQNQVFYSYSSEIERSSAPIIYDTYTQARAKVKDLLEKAVEKRVLNTERPIGCLLSGGLDSSIICGLVSNYYKTKFGKPIHTFSIGFEGSTDCKFARKVAEHLGTIHHEVVVTEKDMLEAIPEVVRLIESYDTTSVRASTPMYLLCKYISQHTDIKVIFSGEGSDELSGSYLYFYNAPSEKEFYEETLRLVKDLSYFDVLRCDKSISSNGLEARVPFLDKDFVNYYLHLDPSLKMPSMFNCEKYLLRDAFVDLLPSDVVWRTKEAFSDGVSCKEKSWFQVIQDYVKTLDIPEKEYEFNPPVLKETKWYRMLYDSYYPNQETLIPYYWLPKWSNNVQDPSARVLSIYNKK